MKNRIMISSLAIGLLGAAASGLVSAQSGYGSDSTTTQSDKKSGSMQSDRPAGGMKSESGATGSSSGVGQFIDDATVTTRVKSRFARDDQVSAMNIGVETNDGVVQLSGFAGSEAEKKRAEEIARQVPEARSVQNNIVVQGSGMGKGNMGNGMGKGHMGSGSGMGSGSESGGTSR